MKIVFIAYAISFSFYSLIAVFFMESRSLTKKENVLK